MKLQEGVEQKITTANLIKTNTAVICCHYRLNYRSIFKILNLSKNANKLPWYFNPKKV
jgi:hypothetical protein